MQTHEQRNLPYLQNIRRTQGSKQAQPVLQPLPHFPGSKLVPASWQLASTVRQSSLALALENIPWNCMEIIIYIYIYFILIQNSNCSVPFNRWIYIIYKSPICGWFTSATHAPRTSTPSVFLIHLSHRLQFLKIGNPTSHNGSQHLKTSCNQLQLAKNLLKINGTIFLNFKIGVHQNDETVSISATYSMKSNINMCGSAVVYPEAGTGLWPSASILSWL